MRYTNPRLYFTYFTYKKSMFTKHQHLQLCWYRTLVVFLVCFIFFLYCLFPPGHTGGRRHYVLDLSVRWFVTKLVNTMFWKRMNRFWCQLAQVVRGAKAWNDQRWGQEVKCQGQTRPKIDLEASTFWGRVVRCLIVLVSCGRLSCYGLTVSVIVNR